MSQIFQPSQRKEKVQSPQKRQIKKQHSNIQEGQESDREEKIHHIVHDMTSTHARAEQQTSLSCFPASTFLQQNLINNITATKICHEMVTVYFNLVLWVE
jgi:hypothetical protein